MLSHFLRAATPKGSNSTVTYISVNTSSTDLTTYTFNLSGTFNPALYVFGISSEDIAATGTTLSTVTFAGNSASSVVNTSVNASGGNVIIGAIFAYRQTSSVTNPAIVLTFSATTSRVAVGLWSIVDNSSDTAADTKSSSFTSSGSSLTNDYTSLQTNDVGVCVVCSGDNNSVTWTNATERYDGTIGGENTRASGADFKTTTTGNRTITAASTVGAGDGMILVSAVWR